MHLLNSNEQYRNFIAGESQLLKLRCASCTTEQRVQLIQELGLGDSFYQPVNDSTWKENYQKIIQQEASDPMLRGRNRQLQPTDYFIVCLVSLCSLIFFASLLPDLL